MKLITLHPPAFEVPLFALAPRPAAARGRPLRLRRDVPHRAGLRHHPNNLEEPACADSFTEQLGSALEQQGRPRRTPPARPPRPALPAARGAADPLRSGRRLQETTYGFYLEPRSSETCVLRLYERRTERAVTTNTINFYATRTLATCRCDWAWVTRQSHLQLSAGYGSCRRARSSPW